MSVSQTVAKQGPRETDQDLLASIELSIGGRANISEVRAEERAGLDDTTVLETDDPQGYLTVQKESGNGQKTYEYCFRVRGHTANLTTLTHMEEGKDCETYWIPEEVREAIHLYHPNINVENSW